MNYEKTKKLVKSGHQLVVLLGTQNGMHEAASLVQRMAGQLDVLIAVLREKTKQCDQLAAENAGLKGAISQQAAGFTVCEACGEENVSGNDDVCRALNETPATDAFLREVRAQGAEAAAAYIKLSIQQIPEDLRVAYHDAIELCSGAAYKLRQGGAA
ncbi:hypothetical protein ACETRY_06380 [Cronobacter malonaticus]|uniref:hypothetical protein n=1 Tax=Cronobacter malonaticus TaxID=413503 RepID=UPI003864809F